MKLYYFPVAPIIHATNSPLGYPPIAAIAARFTNLHRWFGRFQERSSVQEMNAQT